MYWTCGGHFHFQSLLAAGLDQEYSHLISNCESQEIVVVLNFRIEIEMQKLQEI